VARIEFGCGGEEEMAALEKEVFRPRFLVRSRAAHVGNLRSWRTFEKNLMHGMSCEKKFWIFRSLASLSEKESDESMESEVVTRVGELEARYQAMEFSMLMAGPHDAANAVMAIHAGAGGTDAQDWAEMLIAHVIFDTRSAKVGAFRLVDESRGWGGGD
jgi:peptide chain release factor 2